MRKKVDEVGNTIGYIEKWKNSLIFLSDRTKIPAFKRQTLNDEWIVEDNKSRAANNLLRRVSLRMPSGTITVKLKYICATTSRHVF